MLRLFSIVLFLCVPAVSMANDNLIENGDFELGKKRWNGDTEIVFDTPAKTNSICRFEVGSSASEFHQKFYVNEFNHLTVRFKVRASGSYKGEGINIKIRRQDGGGMSIRRTLESNNEWSVMEQEFKNYGKGIKRAELYIIVNGGTRGLVSFDDIEVHGSMFLEEKHPC